MQEAFTQILLLQHHILSKYKSNLCYNLLHNNTGEDTAKYHLPLHFYDNCRGIP